MLTNYLYILITIIFLSQPKFVKMVYSSILGRIILLISIIFCTYKNHMLGFVYAFLLIVILKMDPSEDYVEKFGPRYITPADYLNENELEPEISTDREKMEKKMITPVSSKNSVAIITPLTYDYDNIEPTASEPVTTEPFLDYSYISDDESVSSEI